MDTDGSDTRNAADFITKEEVDILSDDAAIPTWEFDKQDENLVGKVRCKQEVKEIKDDYGIEVSNGQSCWSNGKF